MTILQMECFVESAKTESFSKAGTNLFISQQSISQQIKALEKELGFLLFIRKSVGVKLTPEGELIYDEWKELLFRHKTVIDKARDSYSKKSNIIRIGIQDIGLHMKKALVILELFCKRFPDLDIRYELLNRAELNMKMDSGNVDIVIMYETEKLVNPNVKRLVLQTIYLGRGMYIGNKHPLAKKEKVSLLDLKGYTMGVFSQDASADHKVRVLQELESSNMIGQINIQEFSSKGNLLLGILAGQCVTIGYEGMFNLMEDQLVFHPFLDDAHEDHLVVAWLDDKFQTKARNIVYAEEI